ncbi:hypothetical protein RI367_005894 [Sorochytrium milnesiophthora]
MEHGGGAEDIYNIYGSGGGNINGSSSIHQQRRDSQDRGRSRASKSLKRSRWGPESKLGLPPTMQAGSMTRDQIILYVLHLRSEEISRRLRTNSYIPRSPSRSPSPEPQYSSEGKRINTREFRYRKRLEDERHKLVQQAGKLDPHYRPPDDYRRPTRLTEKIYIPVREFPEINFIGLLLGPRGSTLKNMENESLAKIAIRGKGSVKEGKGAPTSYQNQEEDLHCLITADSDEKVKKAVQLVNHIIETASTVPEHDNELKRKQLRDLAALNGTLRDDENQICQNCGGVGHKRWNCPEKQNYTNNIVCHVCGGVGHMSRDCVQRKNPEAMREVRERDSKLDSEYANLMAELGAGPEGASGGGGGGGGGGAGGAGRPYGGGGGGGGARPWQTGAGGGGADASRSGSSLPPWAAGATGLGSGRAPGFGGGGGGMGGGPPAATGGPAPWAMAQQQHQQPGAPAPAPGAPAPMGSAPGYPDSSASGAGAAGATDPNAAAAYQQYYQYYYYQQMLAAQQQQQQQPPPAPQ